MGQGLPPICIRPAIRFIANMPVATRAGVVSSVVVRAIPFNCRPSCWAAGLAIVGCAWAKPLIGARRGRGEKFVSGRGRGRGGNGCVFSAVCVAAATANKHRCWYSLVRSRYLGPWGPDSARKAEMRPKSSFGDGVPASMCCSPRTTGHGQAALRHQPTPGEERGNAMSASHQAYPHARLKGLLDHPNLLRRGPVPTALNRRDDLNAIARIGHRHGCMPHTCYVGDRVRSVRGLSHNAIGRRLTFRKTSLEYRCVGACTAHHANYRRGENARLVYLWDVSVVAH
jgi:hypothetical protein